jgi:predicted transcriptional regulator of viral defense system
MLGGWMISPNFSLASKPFLFFSRKLKKRNKMAKYELPKGRTFITTDYMRKRYGAYDPNIFRRWVDQGKVEKVRNGVYRSSDYVLESDWDRYAIANVLQYPSYVSLYSALYFYNLIPEYVFNVTSVSTKKTQAYTFRGANYTFQQLKPSLFFGYHILLWKGSQFSIALLEKAILDLAYLEPMFVDPDWLEEMRFDEDVLREEVDWAIVAFFAQKMNAPSIFKKINALRSTYSL